MRMWWVLGFAIVVLSSMGATRACQAGAVDFDEKVYSPLVDEDGDGDAELELRQGADIGKAQQLLGYAPSHRIQRGLELAMEWYRRNVV